MAAPPTERRLVNDARHELRTPLTLLATELELALRRQRTAAELEQTIRAAAADTADLIALTDTLLTIGVPPHPDPQAPAINISNLLAELVDRYRAATATSRTLDSRIEPNIWMQIDPARLSQIMTNLLDNAVRHGAGTITTTAYQTPTLISVAVHDNGTGIEPAFLPHATERFSRADASRTSPGTGLGLALVDTIVRTYDGELRICSAGVHHIASPRFDTACSHPPSGTSVSIAFPNPETRTRRP